MEIILKEDVINLGYKGDIVKVKDGYGRNLLIPTKKAVLATESAKKMLAEDNRQRAHKLESIKNTATEMAEKYFFRLVGRSGLSFHIPFRTYAFDICNYDDLPSGNSGFDIKQKI